MHNVDKFRCIKLCKFNNVLFSFMIFTFSTEDDFNSEVDNKYLTSTLFLNIKSY